MVIHSSLLNDDTDPSARPSKKKNKTTDAMTALIAHRSQNIILADSRRVHRSRSPSDVADFSPDIFPNGKVGRPNQSLKCFRSARFTLPVSNCHHKIILKSPCTHPELIRKSVTVLFFTASQGKEHAIHAIFDEGGNVRERFQGGEEFSDLLLMSYIQFRVFEKAQDLFQQAEVGC